MSTGILLVLAREESLKLSGIAKYYFVDGLVRGEVYERWGTLLDINFKPPRRCKLEFSSVAFKERPYVLELCQKLGVIALTEKDLIYYKTKR